MEHICLKCCVAEWRVCTGNVGGLQMTFIQQFLSLAKMVQLEVCSLTLQSSLSPGIQKPKHDVSLRKQAVNSSGQSRDLVISRWDGIYQCQVQDVITKKKLLMEMIKPFVKISPLNRSVLVGKKLVMSQQIRILVKTKTSYIGTISLPMHISQYVVYLSITQYNLF